MLFKLFDFFRRKDNRFLAKDYFEAGDVNRMKRVLIVDDSPTEMQMLSNIMKQGGYEVVTADHGEEGVEKAKSSLPDIILMDIVMPGMNGFQATRQISKNSETAHIPIIIITTKDQETDRIWGLRQGAKDFLTKPVQAQELLATIKNLSTPTKLRKH